MTKAKTDTDKSVLEAEVITLVRPVERREAEPVNEIALRPPADCGVLRGLQMANVIIMDTDTMAQLCSRLSSPPIKKDEFYTLDPEDGMKIATTISGFFNGSFREERSR